MSKLKRFCLLTPLKVLGISIILSCILAFIMYKLMAYNMEKNNIRDGLGVLAIYLVIICNFISPLLSYSISLNLYKRIRDNVFFSFLSFYLPMIICFMVLLFIGETSIEILSFWIMALLPFLLPQTFYFVLFRRKLKIADFNEND